MKAFTVIKYGANTELQLVELPIPGINVDEVLVEIHAASLNLLDSKIKAGEFKLILPYKKPFIAGHDMAGIVIKIGSNVKSFKVGDEVYARAANYHIGTFAEYIAIHEKDLAIKPGQLTMEEAASLPLVALTAWQALVERAQLITGQNVFIQAGSGGVGTIAIQLAKHLGATVATTTSAANFELVKGLGADVIIDYKKEDFETVLKDYDVVLNSQDTKTLEKSLRIVKSGGKVISISGPPTPEFAASQELPWYVKLATTLLSSGIKKKARKRNVEYSFLFMRANGAQLNEITKLVNNGIIRPVVDKVFSFDKMNEAIKYIESGRAKGKVVVTIR